MELLFIGVACTESTLIESNNKYYNGVPQLRPQQYFDLDLVSGISEKCDVHALSLPPVATYPKSTCLIYPNKKEKISESLKINYISLINLPIIKTIIIMINVLLKTLIYVFKNRKRERVILCGYVSFETSLPALLIAKFTNTKILTVVPDVSLYSLSYSNEVKKWKSVKNLVSWANRIIERNFHGYIFLTEEMNNLINRYKKQYIVIEGMIKTDNFDYKDDGHVKLYPRVIMYAGTLHEKFGIKKLIESFTLANVPNCELWIFGSGDYEENIKSIVQERKNIKFKGNVSKQEIFKLERKATLLINPRPSNEEFTKYSFPSKTLEYMVSGTPLLTTKLPGIPNDYDNYLFYFEHESIDEMSRKIKEIMSYPEIVLNDFGEEAKKFVLENKNNKIQTDKIFDFLIETLK
ncbi:glycosyltransferase [Sporosarcina luteola]|uniref:glycosyltransferase n=1 Tax=Sporosarcina luteola TaxID=582850 RepID=UPI00203C2BAD|nr:glycosyltransferase [Sporosarcina luteola]MCM3636544.1 glycosyltransferase [Sporosarcina luteola]